MFNSQINIQIRQTYHLIATTLSAHVHNILLSLMLIYSLECCKTIRRSPAQKALHVHPLKLYEYHQRRRGSWRNLFTFSARIFFPYFDFKTSFHVNRSFLLLFQPISAFHHWKEIFECSRALGNFCQSECKCDNSKMCSYKSLASVAFNFEQQCLFSRTEFFLANICNRFIGFRPRLPPNHQHLLWVEKCS